MSRRRVTPPEGGLDQAEGEVEDAGPRTAPARHTYNLRNRPRKNWAATEPKVVASSATMPGAGEEADNRHVGLHGNDDSVPPSEEDDESGASSAERSGDLFGESDANSNASSEWAESRSRITTPGSSTPASPKRRPGIGGKASQRLTVVKDVAVDPNRPHLQEERLGEAPRRRHAPLAAVEDADPADLEARSTRLIAQL